jgi:hypothetical protein
MQQLQPLMLSKAAAKERRKEAPPFRRRMRWVIATGFPLLISRVVPTKGFTNEGFLRDKEWTNPYGRNNMAPRFRIQSEYIRPQEVLPCQ